MREICDNEMPRKREGVLVENKIPIMVMKYVINSYHSMKMTTDNKHVIILFGNTRTRAAVDETYLNGYLDRNNE